MPATIQDVYYLLLGDCPESFEYFCARISEAVSDGNFEAVLAQPLPLLPDINSVPLNSAKTKEYEIAEVRDMYSLLRLGVQQDRRTIALTKQQVEQCLQHVSQQNKIYPALRLFLLSATQMTYQELLRGIIEYVHSEANLGYQIKAKKNQTAEILTPEVVFRAILNGQQL